MRRDSRVKRSLMASRTTGGGSSTITLVMTKALKTKVATSIAYCIGAAKIEVAASTVKANPIRRSALSETMALVIDRARLWRVVRGAPKNAKVSAMNANG